jgi:eukaryotic-like serine/threonine-protein kinase
MPYDRTVVAGGTESETALLRMRPRSAAPDSERTTPDQPSDPTGTSIGSPIEALERDEILRTRTFSLLVMLLATVGVIVALVIPGGDIRGILIMLGACVVSVGSMLFLLYQTRDPIRFRKRSTALVWFLPASAVNAAVLFFGIYSPALMIVVLGLYFVGLGKAGRMAITAYFMCAALYTGMWLPVFFGAPDIGLMRPALDPTQQVIILLCVHFVLALTMVTARMSRRTALLAVGELEQAVRLAAHRQALLLEARDELERALRSKRGRFSEQAIGSYRLGDVLGRGAMGEVYEAVDTRTKGRVAIKLLSQASLGNQNLVLRFFRELRTATAVESPHVVRVIEIGEQPVPFLVMERLEGETLAELLRARRALTPAEVVDLVSQIAIGVTAAATAGIVHRDLKPQNVFRHHDVWKVLDFGVARAMDQGDTLTAGQIVGTPSYMAPEQASGGAIDHRTDLYALAAIAYRALTGHPPFSGKEVAETLYRVVHTRPTRPTLLAPELPAAVDAVLAKGMARRPTDRFASATEFATALRDALAA